MLWNKNLYLYKYTSMGLHCMSLKYIRTSLPLVAMCGAYNIDIVCLYFHYITSTSFVHLVKFVLFVRTLMLTLFCFFFSRCCFVCSFSHDFIFVVILFIKTYRKETAQHFCRPNVDFAHNDASVSYEATTLNVTSPFPCTYTKRFSINAFV